MIPRHLTGLSPQQAELYARRAPVLLAALARRSVNTFVEYVGRDEETGKSLVQAEVHRTFQVLANRYPRLLLWAFPESGKSVNLSILRPLWKLGNDPSRRIVIVSATQNNSRKIARAMQQYITAPDSTLRAVFPHLLPGRKWTETAFDIQRTDVGAYAKDYSVQAIGLGSTVLGSRIDDLIIDDVLTHENTRNEAQRNETAHWYDKTISSRLSGRATVTWLGNAWHPKDQMHRLELTPGWHAARFPVEQPDGTLTWPEKWSRERIEQRRETTPPTEFARELLCRARSDEDARFQQDWIDRCLRRGEGLPEIPHLPAIPTGYRVYTGVDLGTREKSSSDLTVLFTIAVHPDGTREVLCVESGRWGAPTIMQRIRSMHARYKGVIVVESNAAQDFLRQLLTKESTIPVLPFTTGKNKHDPTFGVETLAIEFFNSKWIIPSRGGQPANQELREWVSELLNYHPSSHTGDRMMASWIAKVAADGLLGQRRKGRTGTLRL